MTAKIIPCDICGQFLERDASCRISSSRMANLAEMGFGTVVPNMEGQDPSRRAVIFRHLARHQIFAWRLCEGCGKLADSWQTGPAHEDASTITNFLNHRAENVADILSPTTSPEPDQAQEPPDHDPPLLTDGNTRLLDCDGGSSAQVGDHIYLKLRNQEHVYVLKDGETATLLEGGKVLVLHPDHRARTIYPDGKEVVELKGSTLFLCATLIVGLFLSLWLGKYPLWWWQSHEAIAEAHQRGRLADWKSADDALQRALVIHPQNPRLLASMATLQIIRKRPYVAGVYFRALSQVAPAQVDRTAAAERANSISKAARARAHAIMREAFRVYDALPSEMRQQDGPSVKLYEALTIPPVVAAANMDRKFSFETIDRNQLLCIGIIQSCDWSGEGAWTLRHRKLEIYMRGSTPCCEMSLDDPDLVDPAEALQRMSRLPPGHQVRAMFRLATKFAFLANMISSRRVDK